MRRTAMGLEGGDTAAGAEARRELAPAEAKNEPRASGGRAPGLDPQQVWADAKGAKAETGGAGTGNLAGNGSGRSGVADAQSEFHTPMAEPQFSTAADDDLPRTFRREKAARERAREAQANHGYASSADGDHLGEAPPATVTGFDVPFLRMVTYFLKAAVAAIPALILLGLIMFAMGKIAQKLLPWLIQMRIVITFPG